MNISEQMIKLYKRRYVSLSSSADNGAVLM